MKLLVDMNLSPRWCAFLTPRGFPALHWSNAGPPTATDADILAYAHRHRSVLLTADVNLAALAEITRRSTISVLQISAADLAPEVIGDEVIACLRVLERQLLAGALVRVKPRAVAAAVPSEMGEANLKQSWPSPASSRAFVTGGMPGARDRYIHRAELAQA